MAVANRRPPSPGARAGCGEALCLALESLDGRSRELIRLKLGENMSYQQISACTGLPTGHVGHLLHQALKAVATELARGGMVP